MIPMALFQLQFTKAAMNISKSLLQGLIHCAFWVIGFLVASKLMAHSEARIAYGYLTGWWTALYLGYIAKFKISSLVSALTIYFCTGILAVFLNWSWFYKGLPTSVTPRYLLTLAIGGAVFVSPILINLIVRKIVENLNQ